MLALTLAGGRDKSRHCPFAPAAGARGAPALVELLTFLVMNYSALLDRLGRYVVCLLVSAAALAAQVDSRSQFVNLSARGQVGSGQNALVAGFVIEGPSSKHVLVRVAGPTLANFGVTGSVAKPRIQLYSGNTLMSSNEGWGTSPDAAAIATATAQTGAFAFPANSLDSAIVATLAPGAYTAVVSGMTADDGTALLEVYTLPNSSATVLTPAKKAAVQKIVDTAVAKYEIPGIMYAVKFLGEAPWTGASGVRDLATKEALTATDYIRIGSASKTFIGMAALRLIEQDKLEFETTIDRMLPADVLSNYDRKAITVRMLLSHTSGINNYTNYIEDWFFPYILDRTRLWTNEELVALVNSKFSDPELGRVFTPGAGWYYSNTNTVLLGMIVEKVTGKPINQVIQDDFITPLGLTQTIYPTPGQSEMPATFARGYMNWANFTGEPSLPSTLLDVTTYDPSGVGPAGAMVSTVGDLSLWMEALAHNSVIGGGDLQRGHLDWKYFVSFAGGEPGASVGSYGMNMAHEPDPNNNADYWIVGHRGQLSGYDTAMMYLPELDVALVLACTRSLKFEDDWPQNALTAALNDVIGELFPELIAENKLSTSAVASPVTGTRSDKLLSVPATSFSAGRFNAPLTEY